MVGLYKKPKNLSASEKEDREYGNGVGVYATLLQTDTVQSYGDAKVGTRPVGIDLGKKTSYRCEGTVHGGISCQARVFQGMHLSSISTDFHTRTTCRSWYKKI